ncbi:MAG: tRNA pseudouridine(55) synthase TruB [Pseudomonadota bacterium]|nr:tRNA pseudouridine(55) synthase TruB [Pseudomonadota bacterium]
MGRRGRSRRGMPVNGVLLLDKPAGITSNGALQEAKQMLFAQKAGHTGSLDPIATGLLPLCFGEATKISSLFLGADKRYWVRIKLGETTRTGDCEGEVIERRPVAVTAQEAETALEKFRGDFEQVPPMYSALKKNGQPLYKLARQGIEVEREPRPVSVYSLELLSLEGDMLELDLACSRGFYVRSLAVDLGETLGCGGHVVALRRTAVGGLKVGNAITLDELQASPSPKEREQFLLTVDRALEHLPRIDLSDNVAFYFCRGQSVRAADLPAKGWVRVYSEGAGFLGLGEITDDHRVAPKKLMRPAKAV